jgi:cytochrome c553
MKLYKLAVLILAVAAVLFVVAPGLSWANDGPTLFKAKCAACHGADGMGKPAAKIPSLVSDDVKKMSDADLQKFITTNPKHAGVAKSLSADDVKAVIGNIRTLQK